MTISALYQCIACGSTKEIVHDPGRNGNHSIPHFPFTVYCGWRGCDEAARCVAVRVGDVVVERAPELPVSARPEGWREKAHELIWERHG